MARAHSLLATQKWTGADLRTLVQGELAAHDGRVDIAGPAVLLSPEAVQPVAMLLHELATNATKYGALQAQDGRVALDWRFEGTALQLRWTERGGPPLPAPPARRGFGSRLIASLVGQQLGGRVEFDWAPAGLTATIRLAPRCAGPAETPLPICEVRERPASAAPAGAPAPLPAASGPPPRVLLVEDEALLALELEATLRELGCEVVGPARSLGEAVRFAAAEPALAAAVLDVNLGGGEMSFPAVDLLQTRGVPYIFATGYGSVTSLEGRDHGAVAVLIKPYPKAAMREALAAALRVGRHRAGRAGARDRAGEEDASSGG
jgi:CheY-like chemotaxis protein